MKYLIASDLHGSAYWTEKLLNAYKTEKADKLVLLGDILYHGPRNDFPENYNPKNVIEMLNAVKTEILCVRGNCDAEVDQMVLNFPIMADYAVIEYQKHSLFLTHGHVYNENALPPLKNGDVLIHGHTHVTALNIHSNYVYMNPGSVSLPKEGTKNGYLLFENGLFIFKTFDGYVINEYKID